ncbi:MAG: hypothetical protein J5542_05405 [Bacteroidales bacterium]|nr:hypothetical protein [Bacteroidales bacterium]
MDLNLFLLRRKEQILLQNIDLFKGIVLGNDFEFRDTRNHVDVEIPISQIDFIRDDPDNHYTDEEIIRIKETGEKDIERFRKELDEEEKKIRKEIEDERENRSRRDSNEEWPSLPYFERREQPEFIWEYSDDNFPYNESDNLQDWLYSVENEIEEITDLTDLENSRLYRGNGKENFEDGFENLLPGFLSNYHLKLLDDRIKRIHIYRKRLNSGSLLGCFSRYFDSKGKEKSRRIRLFLDNIDAYAKVKGVDREEILAQVYIHELMHAYYSDILTKRYSIVDCVTEVEEAMAEFGMLCIMESMVNAKMVSRSYLTTAIKCVKSKWSSTDPDLNCYGLGYHLYGVLCKGGYCLNGKLLSIYQNVQHSVINDKADISSLKLSLRRGNLKKCVAIVHYLLTIFNFIKKDTTQHHLFDHKTFGWNNMMVYDFLEYYVNDKHPDFATLKSDFTNSFNPKYTDPCCADASSANPQKYEMKRKMKLTDVDIVPRCVWNSDKEGTTYSFIKDVDDLYKKKRIAKRVLYLG